MVAEQEVVLGKNGGLLIMISGGIIKLGGVGPVEIFDISDIDFRKKSSNVENVEKL